MCSSSYMPCRGRHNSTVSKMTSQYRLTCHSMHFLHNILACCIESGCSYIPALKQTTLIAHLAHPVCLVLIPASPSLRSTACSCPGRDIHAWVHEPSVQTPMFTQSMPEKQHAAIEQDHFRHWKYCTAQSYACRFKMNCVTLESAQKLHSTVVYSCSLVTNCNILRHGRMFAGLRMFPGRTISLSCKTSTKAGQP
jgi:hypothetical protein